MSGGMSQSETELRNIIVSNPDGPDYEVRGRLVHEGYHKGIGNVWVYRTERGRWVVKQMQVAAYGRPYIERAAILEKAADIARWLGMGRGAKEVMEAIGQPLRTVID